MIVIKKDSKFSDNFLKIIDSISISNVSEHDITFQELKSYVKIDENVALKIQELLAVEEK